MRRDRREELEQSMLNHPAGRQRPHLSWGWRIEYAPHGQARLYRWTPVKRRFPWLRARMEWRLIANGEPVVLHTLARLIEEGGL